MLAEQSRTGTFGVDGGDAFGGPDVPDPNGLVSRCRHEQIGVGGMPAELVHAVTVTSVVVFFHLESRKTTGAKRPVALVTRVWDRDC